jgi:uncharacterized protein YbjQ (UPF0145 family)
MHRSPKEEAAREDAARQREELARRAKEVREAEQRRQAHDLAALAAGGLPLLATERLKEIGSSDADSILFTSNLSAEEAALLRREGFRVRGMITGSAVYHVGKSYASTEGDCEITVLSDAYNTATELAVSRMHQELRLIGAHGVVGVRLTMVRHEWAEKTVEVRVVGTAIEGPGRPPADPWMCDLSGQEWWALHQAGYEPAALVWGHCTWFILTTAEDERIARSWNNQELVHWSSALSTARHRALSLVIVQAQKHNATGIAGVTFERHVNESTISGPGFNPVYEREHHDLVVSIIGTAIRRRPDAPMPSAEKKPVVHVLSLRDGRIARAEIGDSNVTLE